MTILELANAHLETVRTRIAELAGQKQQIDAEIQRLNEILEEGTRLVDGTNSPS
jgi:chaperonin cofactor prefoldin